MKKIALEQKTIIEVRCQSEYDATSIYYVEKETQNQQADKQKEIDDLKAEIDCKNAELIVLQSKENPRDLSDTEKAISDLERRLFEEQLLNQQLQASEADNSVSLMPRP